ncbi:threonine/serine exporter family protein [Microbacterium sp. APC 3898]|uniref:Threonine/serine exporter family protein n=2 Tax=Planococcus TaxID=1372 RepID=A0ABT7ZKU0_9BACL|nr:MULTISPECIES: threonine/serine exporter family protein [Terrabacteria group]MBD8013197.1 threonine/serine exporter family protein [Planococcus wigleyi]MDN3427773.1 threonine/serine exporter family protein [Planococcus sp. APC 4016]MDN3437127.1 threonine/serine exporter family protein [Planococcus sp. APC 3900]MDN3499325.1 threonine/serine exporter family protein [Microbacterium sp. APC 3898]
MAQIGETRRELALDCFLLAGRIMMESGAETYRVEDTMIRMAVSQNMVNSHCFVTPTGIMFSPSEELATRFVRINNRSTDLERVALVNSVSRNLVSGEYTLQQAYDEMLMIDQTNYRSSIWVQTLAASVASACFFILLGGSWINLPFAFVIGGIGFIIVEKILEETRVKIFAEFIGAFVIGILASLAVYSGIATNLDTLIIGSIMPLVPGLLITNAVRDLMAGHFVSGLSKGAEAFLTAFAIGAGIALVISF